MLSLSLIRLQVLPLVQAGKFWPRAVQQQRLLSPFVHDAAEEMTSIRRIIAKHVLMLPLSSNSLSSFEFSKRSMTCKCLSWNSRFDETMEVEVVHVHAFRGSLSFEQFEQENPVAVDINIG